MPGQKPNSRYLGFIQDSDLSIYNKNDITSASRIEVFSFLCYNRIKIKKQASKPAFLCNAVD
jgi:hypothetical protein